MEKPMLFNTVMVQAILEDKKISTRRPVKRTACNDDPCGYGFWKEFSERDQIWYVKDYTHAATWWTLREYISRFSKYHVGDTIWVRETWQESECFDFAVKGKYAYLANEEEFRLSQEYQIKWRPSIHMPKVAARLFLKVTDVKVERLKNITEIESLKEGFISTAKDTPAGDDYTGLYAYEHFIEVWDKIYSKKGNGWDDDPWVWVIEFERI